MVSNGGDASKSSSAVAEKLRSTITEARDEAQDQKSNKVQDTAEELDEPFDVYDRSEVLSLVSQIVPPTYEEGETGVGQAKRHNSVSSSLNGASWSTTSFAEMSKSITKVDISRQQAGIIMDDREAMTADWDAYVKLRDKVLYDTSRSNYRTIDNPLDDDEQGKRREEEAAPTPGKAAVPIVTTEESAPMDDDAKQEDSATSSSNKKKEKAKVHNDDPHATAICYEFWTYIDSLMEIAVKPVGLGTVPIGKDNEDEYQVMNMDLQVQSLMKWDSAGRQLVEIDPYLMLEDCFTLKEKDLPFTPEDALEECLHGVRHGLFTFQMGSTCSRCASSQIRVSGVADVPKNLTCSCGMENTFERLEQLRVKFIFVPQVFYMPTVGPRNCRMWQKFLDHTANEAQTALQEINKALADDPSALKEKMDAMEKVILEQDKKMSKSDEESCLNDRCKFVGLQGTYIFFPGGQDGAKYQYNLDLEPGSYVMGCGLTGMKLRLVVTGDAPPAPEDDGEPERLSVVIRASWAQSGRHTIKVEHGRICIKAIVDTPGTWTHLLFKGFYKGEDLRISESMWPSVTNGNRIMNNPTFNRYFAETGLLSSHELSMGHTVICFTDLLDSTQQYSDLGDGAALKLVKDHFELLFGTIQEEKGRVVKTIGDAVMATFGSVQQALRATTRAMQAMLLYNDSEDCPAEGHMHLKVGIHTGPALMVPLNGINDFFGQTVNIAARVQGTAEEDQIVLSAAALEDVGALEAATSLVDTGVMTKGGTRPSKLKGVKLPVQLTTFTVAHPDEQSEEELMNMHTFRKVAPQQTLTITKKAPVLVAVAGLPKKEDPKEKSETTITTATGGSDPTQKKDTTSSPKLKSPVVAAKGKVAPTPPTAAKSGVRKVSSSVTKK